MNHQQIAYGSINQIQLIFKMEEENCLEQNQISVFDQEMNAQTCQRLRICICSRRCIQEILESTNLEFSTTKQIMILDSQNSQDSKVDHHTFPPMQRLKRIKKVAYFTKNFLPSFKMPHLYYLKKRLGASFVNKFHLIKQLQKKNGITLKDYEDLYKIQEFRPTLKEMLDSKALFRDLMISRSKPGYKITHDQILFNFNQVWVTGTFKKIAQRKEISVPETWVR